MAAEDGADDLGVAGQLGHGTSELPTGTLPRHPGHGAAPDLADQLLPVGGTGQRDDRVRVQVVDVRQVQEPVHRSVDGRRRPTVAEGAVGEQPDHLVLVLHPAIDVVERDQTLALEHGQAGGTQCAQVATGALDVEQLDVLAGSGAGHRDLRRGVATAVVRDAGVGTQPVGAFEQLPRALGQVGALAGGRVGHDVS